MTALQEPLAARKLERPVQEEPHIFLPGISWAFYKSMIRELGPRRSLRITYDRGDMELMTISPRHDSYKYLLGRLFDVLTEELRVDTKCYGSCTLGREDLERALEADIWYYTLHEPQVRGKLDLDLEQDPPPDLAIEIEVTRNMLSRMPVYAALRVPELWRFNGESLTAHLLRLDGTYERSERSPTFPNLPLEELVRFMRMADSMSDTAMIHSFREWIRQHIVPTWKGPAAS